MAHVVNRVIRTTVPLGALLAIAAAPLILPACRSRSGLRPGDSPQGGGPPPVLVSPSADCAETSVSLSFLAAGWSTEARVALAERLSSGSVVPVSFRREGCSVELEPIDGCLLATPRYRSRDRKESRRHRATARDELFFRFPLAASRRLREIDAGSVLRVETQVTQTLELPPGEGVGRAALGGGTCSQATHLIAAAHLGGDRLLVEPEKTGEIAGIFPGCKAPCKPVPVALVLLPIAAPEADAALSEMIEIPAGPFVRGALDGAAAEKPAREIVLEAFAIDRSEVTAAAYDRCVAEGACTPAGTGELCTSGVLGKEQHPINCIDWSQAEAYCRFAGKRLPTEAEWERAARAGTERRFVWGDAWPPPAGVGNFADRTVLAERPHWSVVPDYDDGHGATAPADAMPHAANPQGILHLAGNVAEWTADWFDPKYYAAGPARSPPGPPRGRARVLRGGSFGSARPDDLRATSRAFYAPSEASIYFGARCARDGASRLGR